MSLKLRRTYPILLLLPAILCFLTFALGDQPIVAYTVKVARWQAGQIATRAAGLANDIARAERSLMTRPPSAEAGSSFTSRKHKQIFTQSEQDFCTLDI
jgi:hypothetical protein